MPGLFLTFDSVVYMVSFPVKDISGMGAYLKFVLPYVVEH